MTLRPSPLIGILQYSAGNTGSVQRALTRLGIASCIVEDPDALSAVDGLIFPGAGAAQSAMSDLQKKGLADPIRNFVKPFLGLCLGMQLLFDYSEEGDTDCLGIIRGKVRRLSEYVISPHMGWNLLDSGDYAYFVHSYSCVPDDPRLITMTAQYGTAICAGVRQQNYFGLQWHPEKSGKAGDEYLLSFTDLCK